MLNTCIYCGKDKTEPGHSFQFCLYNHYSAKIPAEKLPPEVKYGGFSTNICVFCKKSIAYGTLHVCLEASVSGGVKHDGDKVRLELFPAAALEEISKVLTFGAKKYADHNWSKGIAYSRLIGAALRHLLAWSRGQDKDPESGLSHLSHAGCCIVFLIWMEKFRSDLDDRHKDPGTNVGVTTETKE